MSERKPNLYIAYYLLGQVIDMKVVNETIVLLTLRGNDYAPQRTVRLLPSPMGLMLYFRKDLTIYLNLNNELYFELINQELLSDFNNSPLDFLQEVLHAGLEDGYEL